MLAVELTRKGIEAAMAAELSLELLAKTGEYLSRWRFAIPRHAKRQNPDPRGQPAE